MRYAKEAISRGLEMPLEQALRFETDLTIILQTTEDRAEGVRAFLEKRNAEFKGTLGARTRVGGSEMQIILEVDEAGR